MWYLVSVSNPDLRYVILVGREYVVGRKDCDVMVEGDKAVSRQHAILTVTHPESNLGHPHKVPELKLADVSKFGTFVNKENLNQQTVSLKDGDEVIFGSPVSAFMAVYEPFVITSSCLDNDSKKMIRSQLLILGGHMVNEWRKDCSLLIMTSISVTIKVICALVSLKAVVKPDYLPEFVQFLMKKTGEPNTEKYLPELAETQLDPTTVSFGKDPRRQSIFKGMKFIFLNPKQFKKMSLAIELAGGTPVLMEEGCDGDDDRVLVEPNTVVMNCNPEDQTQHLTQNGRDWVQHVLTYLKKHKKQVIQDAELGYAVLYCSTNKHCNPNINKGEQLFGTLPSQTLEAEVLVENTEASQMGMQRKIAVISGPQTINETTLKSPSETRDTDTSVKIGFFGGKRKKDESSDFTGPSAVVKKVKTEKISPKTEANTEDTVLESEKKEQAEHSKLIESTRDSKYISSSEDEEPRTVRRFSEINPFESNQSLRLKSKSDQLQNKQTKTDQSQARSPKPDQSGARQLRSVSPKPDQSGARQLRPVSPKPDQSGARQLRSVSPKPDQSGARQLQSNSPKPDQSHSKTSKLGQSHGEDLELDQFLTGKKETSPRRGRPESVSPMKKTKMAMHTDSSDSDEAKRRRSPRSPVRRGAKSSVSDTSPDKTRSGKKDIKTEITSPETRWGQAMEVTGGDTEIELDKDYSERVEQQVRLIKWESETTHDNTEVPDTTHHHGNDALPVPIGFLATNNTHQVERKSDYVKEEDQPMKCVDVQFTSLLVRRVKPAEANSNTTRDGYTTWKGKAVRNFKKFKKSDHVGSGQLPRIIGGSDLIVHTGSHKKELDDWFREAAEAENEQSEMDKRAQDLFDWEPKTKRSR